MRLPKKQPKISVFLATIFLITAYSDSGSIALRPEEDKKLIEKISDRYGSTVNYDYFINNNATQKTLSRLDKKNLNIFIERNFDIISGNTSLEEIDKTNKNIKIDLFVPKIPTEPVVTGTLWFNYIISKPSQNQRGIFGEFSSDIDRRSEDTPWIFSNISMSNPDKVKILTNFNKNDFDKLRLKFSKKFFMSDLKENADLLGFSPAESYKKFHSSGNNWSNYAFYKFLTDRQSIPLTVIFGVEKEQYNSEETYPSNWFYIYIKRGS